MLVSQWS